MNGDFGIAGHEQTWQQQNEYQKDVFHDPPPISQL
jgi:hypothetical protein